MADVAMHNIAPLQVVDVVVKGLEYTDILLHFGQLLPLSLHCHLILCCLLWVPTLWLCLQLSNLPSQDLSVSFMATDTGLDLMEPSLESTASSKSNMVARCTGTLELVVDSGVFVKNMAVAHPEDPGAGDTVLILALMEEQCNTTLGINPFHLLGSNGHAKGSSEELVDIICGAVVIRVSDTQKGWT